MIFLKTCPKCDAYMMMEYHNGEWFCSECGYSYEGSDDDAEGVADGDYDESTECRTCGNFGTMNSDCLESCSIGE